MLGRTPKETPPEKSPLDFPVSHEVIAGELVVHIHRHELESRGEVIPCWSYVSEGLERHGQQEIVFTIRRRDREAEQPVPPDPLLFLQAVHGFAEQGRIVYAGGTTQFGERDLFGFKGVLYLRAQRLAGVSLPPRALAGVLLTEPEVSVANRFSGTRVSSRLGHRYRRYPYPPWADRDRSSLAMPELNEPTLLAQLPVVQLAGASAASTPDSGLTLRLRESSSRDLKGVLEQVPEGQPFALALEVDPRADGCLVWEGPTQSTPSAIAPEGSSGSRVCGCFLAFVSTPEAEDGMKIVEDGFALTLTPANWALILEAIQETRPTRVESAGSPLFALEWVSDDYWNDSAPPKTSHDPLPSGVAKLEETFLLTPEAQLSTRVNVEGLATYIRKIANAVEEHFSEHEHSPEGELLFKVEVAPSADPILTLECKPTLKGLQLEGLSDLVRSVKPPELGGPIEFQLRFSLGSGEPGSDRADDSQGAG